jgi:hypothetical protein
MRLSSLAAVVCLTCASPVSGDDQTFRNVFQIDFRNFSFPWSKPGGAGDFEWLKKFESTVALRDGTHLFRNSDCSGPNQRCPELSIAQILYTDVDNDFVPDALVVLNYSSGGTAHWQYVYMYTAAKGSPHLIAAFQTGTRTYHGLHRVYFGNGHLIIELNEPDQNEGDCCATWRSRVEYAWRNGHFEALSTSVKEEIPVHQRTWYEIR